MRLINYAAAGQVRREATRGLPRRPSGAAARHAAHGTPRHTHARAAALTKLYVKLNIDSWPTKEQVTDDSLSNTAEPQERLNSTALIDST